MNSSQTAQFRRRIGYSAALFFGIVVIVNAPPLVQVAGGVAACVGAVGLLSEGAAYLKELQTVRLAEQKEAHRQAKKAVRREREADNRTRRNAERQTQAHAEKLRREAEAETAALRQRIIEAETQSRYARELALKIQADLLFMLEPEEFVEAVCAAFAGENGTIAVGTRAGEYLCRRANGTVEALFLVMEKREANQTDVEALEAFRRDVNAEHGSLVSRSGFSADSVRRVAEFPITLTDPYLIARLTL